MEIDNMQQNNLTKKIYFAKDLLNTSHGIKFLLLILFLS